MRFSSCVLVSLLLTASPIAAVTAHSPTCGQVEGKTQEDADRAVTFCAKGVSKGAVEGIIANETILAVKVTRQMAEEMMADRLSTEQLIKVWMKGWRQLTGKTAVSVTAEWKDVVIAEGKTTLTRGDVVTIK